MLSVFCINGSSFVCGQICQNRKLYGVVYGFGYFFARNEGIALVLKKQKNISRSVNDLGVVLLLVFGLLGRCRRSGLFYLSGFYRLVKLQRLSGLFYLRRLFRQSRRLLYKLYGLYPFKICGICLVGIGNYRFGGEKIREEIGVRLSVVCVEFPGSLCAYGIVKGAGDEVGACKDCFKTLFLVCAVVLFIFNLHFSANEIEYSGGNNSCELIVYSRKQV